MANLKRFIWDGAHAGQALDLYAGRYTKVGTGSWITVEELRLKLKGSVTILGKEYTGEVEILMKDFAPRGSCTVLINGVRHNDCPYEVKGKRLQIDKVADRTLELEAQDGKWSWVGVSLVPTWVGFWPQGAALDLGRFGPEEKAA